MFDLIWENLLAILIGLGTFLIASTALIVVRIREKYSYLRNKNIPHQKTWLFLGNMRDQLFRKYSFIDFVSKYYRSFKGKGVIGLYQFTTPLIMLRDPELIKKVTVKDFDHFVNRSNPFDSNVETLFGRSLSSLTDQRWKNMRSILSPAFTTSKMKAMFGLITEIGEQMADYIDEQIQKRKDATNQEDADEPADTVTLEMKDFFTKYTNDVVATAAFGIQCNSLQNPDNKFYKMGKSISDFTGFKMIKIFIIFLFKGLTKYIPIRVFPESVIGFFRVIIVETMRTREREGIVRPDMIQLLMAAKKGELKDDSTEDQQENNTDKDTNVTKQKLDDEDVVAQAFIFFLAGFDTSSTLLCFASHQLAVHPEIQERLQQEIDSVLEEDGKLTYEGIQRMKYLDMVVSESLRKYPPAGIFDRKCTIPYTIPATDTDPEITISKGDIVWLPAYALQHDPEYFPDPEKFDPERFSDENKHNIQPYTYLPFGVGPRNCIGMRFALMEAKVALIKLLTRFDFCVVAKTQDPIVLSKKTFSMTAENGFWVGLKSRNSNDTTPRSSMLTHQ